MARVFILAPGGISADVQSDVDGDRKSRVEYSELARALAAAGHQTEVLDYEAVARDPRPLVAVVKRILGEPVALALLAYLRRHECDAYFTSGETALVPLAALLKFCRNRPGHVGLAYEMSKPKTRFFFRWLRIHRQTDTTFVYCNAQRDYAIESLRIPADRVVLVYGHVDARFYRPLGGPQPAPNTLCSAGIAKRDYATLVLALTDVPEAKLTAVPAGHPLSLNRRAIPKLPIPPNVVFPEYEPGGLRDLYASAAIVCVALNEGLSAAGVTTLLEAMAMAKPVIATRSTGLADYLQDGETGLYVAPGDVDGWKRAIRRLVSDPAFCARIGANARKWVERNSTLEIWADAIVRALAVAARHQAPKHAPAESGRPSRML
ncbi:MAG: glycosyltransferase family 4 protein [Alphaproteobacteria bacterium]|nr:glycosyltransferase family 4 protein [Alphaproteobacteria bacterium]